MIAFVAEEADRRQQPLTGWERRILASESPDVDEGTHRRLRMLVEAVVARQKRSGFEQDPRSFMSALPLAGDREYPYIVALAETDAAAAQRTIAHVLRRTMPGPLTTLVGSLLIAAAIVLVILYLLR